jgi:hypothetical protein
MSNVESIKSKIKEIYRNYGLDYEDMSEEEVLRIVEHYKGNNEKLNKDLSDSRDKAIDSDDKAK